MDIDVLCREELNIIAKRPGSITSIFKAKTFGFSSGYRIPEYLFKNVDILLIENKIKNDQKIFFLSWRMIYSKLK
jgi:hypothetical protein